MSTDVLGDRLNERPDVGSGDGESFCQIRSKLGRPALDLPYIHTGEADTNGNSYRFGSKKPL